MNKIQEGMVKKMLNTIKATAIKSNMLPMSVMEMHAFRNNNMGITIKTLSGALTPKAIATNKIAAFKSKKPIKTASSFIKKVFP